ncbi:triple tyrosine motif-containing protein [Paraflavitalea speifideaquila]|uniref:triple tyrosine motif-containing protein n=1 Tax=Paraflavitalea speifideaquila TaxID=3076558 RepID=UPI0028E6BE25|nr:triple tyrosine motif-containing protein [Paraflavitalea speifideiaquila]
MCQKYLLPLFLFCWIGLPAQVPSLVPKVSGGRKVICDRFRMPEVFFTDFKIFNASHHELLLKDRIDLEYDQNYFTVVFAASDFSPDGNTHYAYMLEGRDNNWIDIGVRKEQEFSNLEAKDYVLKVRVGNGRGKWNGKVASIGIRILPPFGKVGGFMGYVG